MNDTSSAFAAVDGLAFSRLSGWFDVSVRAEHVLRIPFRLNLSEPLESHAESSLDAFGTLVLRQKVDVRATSGERFHIIPRVAGPFNVRSVLIRLFPRASYVEHITGVTIADGRVLLS